MVKKKTETVEVSIPIHGVKYLTLFNVQKGLLEDEIWELAMKELSGSDLSFDECIYSKEMIVGNVEMDDYPFEFRIDDRYDEE